MFSSANSHAALLGDSAFRCSLTEKSTRMEAGKVGARVIHDNFEGADFQLAGEAEACNVLESRFTDHAEHSSPLALTSIESALQLPCAAYSGRRMTTNEGSASVPPISFVTSSNGRTAESIRYPLSSIPSCENGRRSYSLAFLLRHRSASRIKVSNCINPIQLITVSTSELTPTVFKAPLSQSQESLNSAQSFDDDSFGKWKVSSEKNNRFLSRTSDLTSSTAFHNNTSYSNQNLAVSSSSEFRAISMNDQKVLGCFRDNEILSGQSNVYCIPAASNRIRPPFHPAPHILSSKSSSISSFESSNSSSSLVRDADSYHSITHSDAIPFTATSSGASWLLEQSAEDSLPSSLHISDSLSKPSLLVQQEGLFPRYVAAFPPLNFGLVAKDPLTSSRRMLPFSHPNFFTFLKSLPQNEFTHLARSVARYRRTSWQDSTPSTIVSVNLCSCCSPHSAPVSGLSFQNDFWVHQLPSDSSPHGVLDTSLTVMLVELHPELEVVEFLDRRLPAVIRQQVGNRLDRNFVVQIFGISFMRSHLSNIWTIGDLPQCTDPDVRYLCSHPLYHHMLYDISNRQKIPIFRNLNLCPIQYSRNRPLPVPNSTMLPMPVSNPPSPSRSHTILSNLSTICSSSDLGSGLSSKLLSDTSPPVYPSRATT